MIFVHIFGHPAGSIILIKCSIKVLINQGGVLSLTEKLIRVWKTELIINSPPKPRRSLLQPVPLPLSPLHLKSLGAKMADIRSFQDEYEILKKSVHYQT